MTATVTTADLKNLNKLKALSISSFNQAQKYRARVLEGGDTNKRLNQAQNAYEGYRDEMAVWRATEGLVQAHEAGNVPPLLARLNTGTTIRAIVLGTMTERDFATAEKQGIEPGLAGQAFRLLRELAVVPVRDLAIEVANAERKVASRGKIDGYYPTPMDVANEMLDFVAAPAPGTRVLEPSCGGGHLAYLVAKRWPGVQIDAIEWNHSLFQVAQLRLEGYGTVAHGDFLEVTPTPIFERVVMNPPFENYKDIGHIEHAYKFLAPGGTLIAILSESSRRNTHIKKVREFQAFVAEHGSIVATLAGGRFKASGTGVVSHILILEKP